MDKFLLKVRPRASEEPEADTPTETVAPENAKKQRTAAAPIALANAGMNGYFAGEPPTGYVVGSGKLKLRPAIAPRHHLRQVFGAGCVRGPVMEDGTAPTCSQIGTPNRPTMGRLNQGSNHRATLSSVRAHRTAMESLLPEGRPLVLVGIGPGVDNACESYLEHYKARGQARQRLPMPGPVPNRPDVVGFIFFTPIVPSGDAFEERASALLALPAHCQVLFVTGSKDKDNLAGLREVARRMACSPQIHVVEGGEHNPFESVPHGEMEGKNARTRAVLQRFVNQLPSSEPERHGDHAAP